METEGFCESNDHTCVISKQLKHVSKEIKYILLGIIDWVILYYKSFVVSSHLIICSGCQLKSHQFIFQPAGPLGLDSDKHSQVHVKSTTHHFQ